LESCFYFLINAKKNIGSQTPLVTQDIQTRLEEAISQIRPTQGDILEVATLDSFETLTRKDTKLLFNKINIGSTTSEIKLKVTYRYHIKLGDRWSAQVNNNVLVIQAPELRPSLPPAIHSDSIEKKVESGWLRFNKEQSLKALEESLTQSLEHLAMTPAKQAMLLEGSKQAVERFLRTWVLSQEKWKDLSEREMKIVFTNEHAHHDDARVPHDDVPDLHENEYERRAQ
jgi:hypothetical protein